VQQVNEQFLIKPSIGQLQISNLKPGLIYPAVKPGGSPVVTIALTVCILGYNFFPGCKPSGLHI